MEGDEFLIVMRRLHAALINWLILHDDQKRVEAAVCAGLQV